jgi:hypothetical protein
MRRIDKAVIGIYASIFIASEFIVIGYAFSNNIIIGISSFAILFAILFAVFGSTINYERPHANFLDRIAGDESIRNDPKRWLELQFTFQNLEYLVMVVAFFNGTAGIANLPPMSNERGYYLLAMFLVPVVGFYYFHSARNILGMGYSEVESSSFHGVRAFSKLAYDLLSQNEIQGVFYLRRSLKLLNSVLSSKEITCEDAETALSYVTIVCRIANELPFKPLIKISKSLAEFSSILDLPDALKTFIGDPEMASVKTFGTNIASRRAFFERITLVAVLLTAVGTAIQAVLPEWAKAEIINFLTIAFTTPIFILFVMTLVLVMILFHFLLKMGDALVGRETLKKLR